MVVMFKMFFFLYMISTFSISIAFIFQDLKDLKTRLELPSRLTPSLDDVNFTFGVHSAAMSVILKYWKDNYDWTKREKRINAFKHFK